MPSFLPSIFRRAELTPPPARDILPERETKLLLAEYYSTLLNFGISSRTPARAWPLDRAVAEGYERVVWVYKAASTIAENVARHDIPFEVITGPADAPETVEDHPLARLLNGTANPLETGEAFLERLATQVLLSKAGAFVEVTYSNGGTPVRLDLLPPGRTRIVPGETELVDHYEVTRINGTRYRIDPDRVRWVRKPHPVDPYSGTTPLEAAGLSMEMDFYARLYNVSFLRNDGRPGGIVGVTGLDADSGMDPEDMRRLEERFDRGPTNAGKVSVIEGNVTYQDLGATPRDTQYQGVSANAKTEILVAFGCPESVLGNAAERTYSNAEAEGYQFWASTMMPFLSRIASAFSADLDDGQRGRFNTEAIEVLQLPARARREEARAEVAAGLRSIRSYAELAGYGDEIEDLPHTRALWMPSALTPLPARAADAVALGGGAPTPDTGTPTGGGGSPDAVPGSADGTGTAGGDGNPGGAEPGDTTIPPATDTSGAGAAGPAPATPNVAASTKAAPWPLERQIAPAAYGGELKAAAAKQPSAWTDITPADTEAPAEAALAAALGGLAARWVAQGTARLKSPRTRKGTRHFKPEYATDTRVGTKALDSAYAADDSAWADDAEATARPLIEAAALAAAAAWLKAAGDKTATAETVRATPTGKAALEAAAAAVPAVVSGAAWQARRAAAAITDVDSSGGTVDDAAAALGARADGIRAWGAAAAADAVGAATEAGWNAAAATWAKTDHAEVRRQWLSRKDDRVRGTHTEAHGQMRPLPDPFKVGEAELRYPRDPLGPPGEVRNCRCRTVWRQRRGQFTAQRDPAEAAGAGDGGGEEAVA